MLETLEQGHIKADLLHPTRSEVSFARVTLDQRAAAAGVSSCQCLEQQSLAISKIETQERKNKWWWCELCETTNHIELSRLYESLGEGCNRKRGLKAKFCTTRGMKFFPGDWTCYTCGDKVEQY